MTSTLSTQPASEPARGGQRALLITAAVVGVLIAATGMMWLHYGTAVFYEMIVAGIATCL
jgi:hypothetical protein